VHQNDGQRFGVSEKKRRTQKQKDCRHQDRADQVDVLEWIERYAPQTIRGVVSEAMRSETMSRFVQRDGENDRQHPQ
jgi:hypothetical protein